MPTAILIGFQYNADILPGCLIDLYHAWKWCDRGNFNIYILTDIKYPNYSMIERAIEKKIMDADAFQFFNNVKELLKSVYTSKDFLKILETIDISCEEKLMIYYSGHGLREGISFPDKSTLNYIDFRNIIAEKATIYTEIFWILDCCNCSNLSLPYELKENKFVLSKKQISFAKQPMLLIKSSDINEKSVSTFFGSLFTYHLFKILQELDGPNKLPVPLSKNRNLSRLRGNISSNIRKLHTGYQQTITIHSSYIIDPVLWLWMTATNKSYDVTSDTSMSILAIRFDTSKKCKKFPVNVDTNKQLVVVENKPTITMSPANQNMFSNFDIFKSVYRKFQFVMNDDRVKIFSHNIMTHQDNSKNINPTNKVNSSYKNMKSVPEITDKNNMDKKTLTYNNDKINANVSKDVILASSNNSFNILPNEIHVKDMTLHKSKQAENNSEHNAENNAENNSEHNEEHNAENNDEHNEEHNAECNTKNIGYSFQNNFNRNVISQRKSPYDNLYN